MINTDEFSTDAAATGGITGSQPAGARSPGRRRRPRRLWQRAVAGAAVATASLAALALGSTAAFAMNGDGTSQLPTSRGVSSHASTIGPFNDSNGLSVAHGADDPLARYYTANGIAAAPLNFQFGIGGTDRNSWSFINEGLYTVTSAGKTYHAPIYFIQATASDGSKWCAGVDPGNPVVSGTHVISRSCSIDDAGSFWLVISPTAPGWTDASNKAVTSTAVFPYQFEGGANSLAGDELVNLAALKYNNGVPGTTPVLSWDYSDWQNSTTELVLKPQYAGWCSDTVAACTYSYWTIWGGGLTS